MHEHAAVRDALVAGPEARKALGGGLRHERIAGEDSHVLTHAALTDQRRIRREHDIARDDLPVRGADSGGRTRIEAEHPGALVDADAAGERGGAQRAGEAAGMDGCAFRELDAGAEHGRGAAPLHLVCRERPHAVRNAEALCGRDIASELHILRRRGGDAQTRGLAPPEITAAALRKGVQAVLGTGTGPRHGECPVGAEQAFHAAEGGPVAVDLAAVLAAGAGAADVGFDHDDIEVGPALLEGEGGPEPGVTAADDGDIGGRLAAQRRACGHFALRRERLREPPGRIARLDRGIIPGRGRLPQRDVRQALLAGRRGRAHAFTVSSSEIGE